MALTNMLFLSLFLSGYQWRSAFGVVRYCPEDGSNCPFNDLTTAEIRTTVIVVKRSKLFSKYSQFPVIAMQEPRKSQWVGGQNVQRLSYAVVFDLKVNLMSQVTVDLKKKSIIFKKDLPHLLPPVWDGEFNLAYEIIQNDTRWQKALSRRGLTKHWLSVDLNGLGSQGPLVNTPGKRLLRYTPSYNDAKAPGFRPVEGFELTLDMNKREIVEFEDTEEVPVTSRLRVRRKAPLSGLKPLRITQIDRSSIRVRGQQVTWYKWKFMYSVDPTHGLQLYHVRYTADCQERLILYKISLSEMLVPYGASGRQWRWRNFFDAGEFGIGKCATSFVLGQDVPENAIFRNCTLMDTVTGHANDLPRCVALYEHDSGMLYKTQERSKRGRQLVIAFLAYIGNYAYLFEYILDRDGTLRVSVRLTGSPLAMGVTLATNDPTCIESCKGLLNDYLVGPTHQHFFNYRIDFDIDGQANHVMGVDVRNTGPSIHNLDGGAFVEQKRILRFETKQKHNVRSSRYWEVVNAQSRNRFGSPRGYALIPGDMTYSYAHPSNPQYPQHEFVSHAFWATAYRDEEQSAAGTFPRTGTPRQGLPSYVNGESVKNADVVVWYTLGVLHSPRAEEWPLMNVHTASFSLVPYNFMSQNAEVPLKGSCP